MLKCKAMLQWIYTWIVAALRFVVTNYTYQLLILVFLVTAGVILLSTLHGVSIADTDPWPLKHHGLY